MNYDLLLLFFFLQTSLSGSLIAFITSVKVRKKLYLANSQDEDSPHSQFSF